VVDSAAQVIWDEVGEQDAERGRLLLELQQECLDAYRRKVDQASRCRAQLRQAIADAQADLAAICCAMGDPPVHVVSQVKFVGSVRENQLVLKRSYSKSALLLCTLSRSTWNFVHGIL
jgi:gamma-glutamyl:cysteine ligase YbdK (ATP-grasp superfamily)